MAANEEPRDKKIKVFVSYSRMDSTFVDKLDVALTARGFEVLVDRGDIYAFEDWWKRIQALIGSADSFVFVLSPDSVKSKVAQKEIAYASTLNKRLAPIVGREVEDDEIPEPLRRLNFIFFDDPTKFDSSTDALVEALLTDIVWIREHTRFGEAARGWMEAGRPRGSLLRSPTLEMAEHWIASRPQRAPQPTEEICAFIAASRRDEHATARLRQIVLVSIFVLLVGIIFGLVGWINQDYLKTRWRWYTSERPFAAANIWPYILAREQEQALKPNDIFRECLPDKNKDYCPEMVALSSGSFAMGSPATEPGHIQNEAPVHEVTIAYSLAVSRFSITFDEWDTCVAYGDCRQVSDAGFGRGKLPAIFIAWNDAKDYTAWLSKMTGKTYRLLSEAEYEYATRAGNTTAYPWGDDIRANGKAMSHCDDCGSELDNKPTVPVGSFPPNQFGLYDMVGNVFEWVEDCMHINYNGAPTDGSAWLSGGNCGWRIVRGGSSIGNRTLLRSAGRGWGTITGSEFNQGFRVARTLER